MNVLTLGLDRTLLELKMYSREKESVFFSFLFPIMLLTLFSVIFSRQFPSDSPMTAAWAFLPGMIAAGVMLTSFQTMAISVATERDDGSLRRIRATPMPPVAYFLGKVGLVGVTSLAQLALLLLIARAAFGVPMPTDPAKWVTFAITFLLGIFSGTVLGIAYSSLASSRSIGAVVIAPLLVLQFISGIYIGWEAVPGWLRTIASIFPLKWIAQGMRASFYPDDLATSEMGGTWNLTGIYLSLALWSALGLLLCVTTFRWYKRGSV